VPPSVAHRLRPENPPALRLAAPRSLAARSKSAFSELLRADPPSPVRCVVSGRAGSAGLLAGRSAADWAAGVAPYPRAWDAGTALFAALPWYFAAVAVFA
jgi:hypothetical protein